MTRQDSSAVAVPTTVERHPVTLQEVAQAAGVSLATASRVLNGSGSRPVRQELRERVLAQAQELRYTANAHAQALAAGVTSTVGLVTHDVSDPYFAAIASGAMRVAMEHDALVMLASTLRDPERELAYVSSLRAQRARAVLLVGSGFNDDRYRERMLQELHTYTATGGRVSLVSQHDLPFDTVLPDNRGGAAALAEALVGLGHCDVAVVTGPRALTTISDRLQGFTEALTRGGGRVPTGELVETDFSQEGGYDATRRLLEGGLRATALFCVSDVMAIGALQALREAGVTVPDELSVVGFDDIPIVRQLTPALSTVALPLQEIGEMAMRLALEAPAAAPRTPIARAQVVLRGTTRALPATPTRGRGRP